MTYITDAANDYQWWENTETVTLDYLRAAGDAQNADITAQRLDPSEAQADFAGVNINGEALVWNIPDTLCTNGTPEIGDTITDAASAVWRIKSIQTVRFGQQFVCLTEKQR